MADYVGPIRRWERADTVPTNAEGGYSGADSVAAQLSSIGDQAYAAQQTIQNLAATATTGAAGSPASVTVTGTGTSKVINFVVPQGLPGEDGADGMGYAEGQALVADAQAAADSSAQSAATVEGIRSDITGAVESAAADLEIVTTEVIESDSAEFTTEDGAVLFAVDDTTGIPHLRGTDAPNAETIPDDSFEVVDGNGGVIFAIDDLSGTPHLRGSGDAGGPAYTETHLVIAAGQSNSVGVSTGVPVGTNDPPPNLFVAPQRGTQAGQIVPCIEPLWHPYADPVAGSRGHAGRFAWLYALEHPGVRVVVVPTSAVGTGFRSDPSPSWAPAREGEAGVVSLYRNAINAATAAGAVAGGAVRTAAILWMQGEDDAVAGTTQAQYEADLDALIAGFRADMPGAATAPFIVGQLAHEFITVRAEGTTGDINAAHLATPARVTRTAFAANPGPGYCATDNTHYTAHGQWLLARSMWDAYDRALYNL